MNEILTEADQLLAEGRNDEAIDLLCAPGVPDTGDICARIAKAYLQLGDAKGDLFSARFFADRAARHGFAEPWFAAVQTACAAPRPADASIHGSGPPFTLGGWQDERAEAPSPYASCALSRTRGLADTPKDHEWLRRSIPCQDACPAHTDIPEYLTAIFDGDYERAYRINLRDNVFPGVLGRVCARPCEEVCRHGWEDLGESVAICSAKRAAADLRPERPVILEPWSPPTGKTIAVVGAGVAGLAAARELALAGHTVTVYERHTQAGGMMDQGIPAFRLPREIIDAEIAQIAALGVDIRCGIDIGKDITLDQLRAEADTVILAAGTLRPNLLDLPGKELDGIRHGLDMLLEANTTGTAEVGPRVVVIGGGFTAMDCARTAQRLADQENASVSVWYRRSVNEMLVTPGELEELEREGIPMEFMVSPVAYLGSGGEVTHVRFIRTELGEPGPDGRRRPIPIPGSEFDVAANTVLLATGQFPQTDWIQGELRGQLVGDDGWLLSGISPETPVPGIFVAGDFAQGASSLISAIGHAKSTVRTVDRYLTGADRYRDMVRIEDVTQTGRIREMDDVPRQEMPALPPDQRGRCDEVETGYDPDLATDETQRCYRCHFKFEIDPDKCIYCDWCLRAKPRPRCIVKAAALEYAPDGRILRPIDADHTQTTALIWIDQEDCIRCGACVAACPVDAISIQKVSAHTHHCPDCPT
jgi:formate dehydrogenase major subunit